MHSMLCFTWWPYSSWSEEALKKKRKVFLAIFKWLINCTFQYFCLNFALSLLVCTVYNCLYENFFSVIPNVFSCHYLHCLHPLRGLCHVEYDSHWSINLW
jgi:hypothetical protein